VGIIPALGLLTTDEHPSGPIILTPWQLLAWCCSLAFFGVFVAVPLRYQTIIREKLRFPSGTATASVIRTLHGVPEPTAAAAAAGSAVQDGTAGGRNDGSSSSQADVEVPVRSVSAAAMYMCCQTSTSRVMLSSADSLKQPQMHYSCGCLLGRGEVASVLLQ
jgi:uncharacterized oligopeptide transporter (OPT) family protein